MMIITNCRAKVAALLASYLDGKHYHLLSVERLVIVFLVAVVSGETILAVV